jgi:hypothetical protein
MLTSSDPSVSSERASGGFSAFENIVIYASKNEGSKYLNNKAVKYVKTIIAHIEGAVRILKNLIQIICLMTHSLDLKYRLQSYQIISGDIAKRLECLTLMLWEIVSFY